VTSEDTEPAKKSSVISDFTSYRLQRLIDEAETVELVLTYAEILYGYESGSWGVDWIGGCPIPTGTDSKFWDKDHNPIMD